METLYNDWPPKHFCSISTEIAVSLKGARGDSRCPNVAVTKVESCPLTHLQTATTVSSRRETAAPAGGASQTP